MRRFVPQAARPIIETIRADQRRYRVRSAVSRRRALLMQHRSPEFHALLAYRLVQLGAAWSGPVGSFILLVGKAGQRWAWLAHHIYLDPQAKIGKGLYLMHAFGLIVGPVEMGDNCVVHHNVTIGERYSKGDHGVPRIGERVWFGPGATIAGDISIGDGATISANAMLTRSVPARCLAAGNPARVVQADYENGPMLGAIAE